MTKKAIIATMAVVSFCACNLASAQSNLTFVKIPELGLQFPLNPAVAKDVRYRIERPADSPSEPYAVLSSKQLAGKEEYCTTEINVLKISGSRSQHPDYMSAIPAKQFKGFFVTAMGPQEACSDNAKVGKMEATFVKNVLNGLKGITASKK
jgi:hypothetical protein